MERYAGLDVSLEQALMTAPGVGVLVALTCARVTDNPQRFAKSSSVGAHAGLTPRRFQSGKGDGTGRISKHGDALRRTCVSEAAGTILHRVAKWSALKAWGTRLAKRIGAKKATVAMARKLAGILHRMGKNGSGFRRPSQDAQAAWASTSSSSSTRDPPAAAGRGAGHRAGAIAAPVPTGQADRVADITRPTLPTPSCGGIRQPRKEP